MTKNNTGWQASRHYLCYTDSQDRNIAEVFEGETAALNRAEELELDWDATYFIFSEEDGETRALPIGIFNTECYFAIYEDNGSLTWTAYISQETALGKTTPEHPFIFNYDVDIGGNGSDVHPI